MTTITLTFTFLTASMPRGEEDNKKFSLTILKYLVNRIIILPQIIKNY